MGCLVGKKNRLNGGVSSVCLGSLWRCSVGSLVGDYQSCLPILQLKMRS